MRPPVPDRLTLRRTRHTPHPRARPPPPLARVPPLAHSCRSPPDAITAADRQPQLASRLCRHYLKEVPARRVLKEDTAWRVTGWRRPHPPITDWRRNPPSPVEGGPAQSRLKEDARQPTTTRSLLPICWHFLCSSTSVRNYQCSTSLGVFNRYHIYIFPREEVPLSCLRLIKGITQASTTRLYRSYLKKI
jgi:hypothetical protein